MYTVLVCGGRDFSDGERVARVLLDLCGTFPDTQVIQGGAKGADRLARNWCIAHGVLCKTYPARWNTEGRSAGPLRNIRMLEEGKPSLVVAFPGGRGTAHMIEIAEKAGVPVRHA